MIVSIVSLKGGVAKTTSAMYLAAAASEDGSKVVVLDADEEASATSWANTALERGSELGFAVVRGEKNTLSKQAKQLAKDGFVVILDTPPNNREALTMAAMVSDLVVIPVSPSGVDVDRLRNTLELLENVQAARDDLTQAVLLTRYDSRQTLAKEALEALGHLSVFDTKIRSLTKYQNFGAAITYLTEYRQAWHEIKEAI